MTFLISCTACHVLLMQPGSHASLAQFIVPTLVRLLVALPDAPFMLALGKFPVKRFSPLCCLGPVKWDTLWDSYAPTVVRLTGCCFDMYVRY